jgi:hypothetical protein
LEQLKRDRASLGRVEEDARALLEQIAKADAEKDGYIRLAAKGRISEEDLDRYLAELEHRKGTARRELEGLRDRRRMLSELDELAAPVDEFLTDLPHFVDREPVIREHQTVPLEREPGLDGGGRLPIYTLTPSRIRWRSPEEIEEIHRKNEAERSQRYRWVYGLLGLRVVAHKDGTLELAWRAGSKLLGPGEPRVMELPLPDNPAWALSAESDSWESLDAIPDPG